MQHLGDYELGETVDFTFVTTEPDTGAPATLSGTPAISAYVGNSVTQITAGITLTADFDSVTGLNHVRAVLTSGNGYADDTDISFVITTGTVDGNSAVGYVVGRLSLGRASSYLRIGAPAGASVSADIAALPTAAENRTEMDSNSTQLAAIVADTAELQTDDIPGLIAALNDLDAAAIRTALGLATANLDTQLAALPTAAENRAEMDSNSTQLAAIVADTGELQTDDVPGLIAALNDLSASEVNDEVVDVLKTDTISELSGVPAGTPTFEDALMWLYMQARNERTTTAAVDTVKNDAGTGIATSAVSDDGTTFTRGEYS